jgi:hypothetical protein
MQFTITKISSHGTQNPIVARLAAQPRQLMDPFNIPEDKKQKICGTLHGGVQHHLLACYDIFSEVKAREDEILRSVMSNGIATQSNGRVASIESIENLERLAHSFLYSAKLALRDIKSVICEFFIEGKSKREKLEDGHYQNLKDWAEGRFGAQDDFAKTIAEDVSAWIDEVYARRNAIEHPGGKHGRFYVDNFAGFFDPHEKKWKCRPPTWKRNDAPPGSITEDMRVLNHNILCFSEDVLIHCLLKVPSAIPIIFYEIPEDERDPVCPIRLRPTIHSLDIKKK